MGVFERKRRKRSPTPFVCGRLALGALAMVGLCANSASAQCLANEIAKLTASDATDGDHLGTSVRILGDLAVVGANRGNGLEAASGAVYVYRRAAALSAWVEEQKLFADDGLFADQFGLAVAINPVDPNVILVGAWADDPEDCGGNVCEVGSAYIFRFDAGLGQWFQEQKLLASDGDDQDRFGWSVSIWGDVAIIGARLDEDPMQGSGSAYVFRYDADSGIWNEQQKLLSPNGGQLGTSVSLQGDRVLIGASGDDEQDLNVGAAYVFRMDTDTEIWLLEQKLLVSDPVEGAAFGWSVSLDGDTALIGAHAAHGNVFGAGAAYVFTYDPDKSGWTEQQKLAASDGNTSDRFGWSVSLQGDLALIGAVLDDDYANGSGSAYIFTLDGTEWNETAKLRYEAVQGVHAFGISVSTDGEHVIVGANFTTVDEQAEAGAAYIYGGLGDCNGNGELDLCDIADGFSRDDNNNGIPDECEPPPPDCPWDLDNNGSVGASDLLLVLASWGPCKDCPADFDADGNVGAADLLALLVNWGPCP